MTKYGHLYDVKDKRMSSTFKMLNGSSFVNIFLIYVLNYTQCVKMEGKTSIFAGYAVVEILQGVPGKIKFTRICTSFHILLYKWTEH